MLILSIALLMMPVAVFGYAYVGYPALLWLLARRRENLVPLGEPNEWPTVTITVPVYNEERSLARKLDELLAQDYPADRRHILVISDASSDNTDEIARAYAAKGVELLRLPTRGGKSAAENAAGALIRGEIVVNSDASVRIPPDALKALVRAFADSTVGVASGRDVSVGNVSIEQNGGEQGYVGYEMWIRALETRVHSIVGASGCFYGIRASIYDSEFPAELSRDFASALIAKKHGYRAVSVEDALCYVPRAVSLRAEFRRKVRTMARGLETLWQWRRFLNPVTYGSFAFMLWSHKLARWMFYLTLPLAALGLAMLSIVYPLAVILLALVAAGLAVGFLGIYWPWARRAPRLISLSGFIVAANVAGILAWIKLLRREQNALWEPTRRLA